MREEYFHTDGEYVESKPIYFWWKLGLFLFVFLLLTLSLYIYFNVIRKIPLKISPETTYLTAPQNARGQVDYQRYLNEKYNTPPIANEDNLLPLLWQITGVNQEDLENNREIIDYLDPVINFQTVSQPRRWQSLIAAAENLLEEATGEKYGVEFFEQQAKLNQQIDLVCAGIIRVDQLSWISQIQNDPALWQELPRLLAREQFQIPVSSQDNELWGVSTAVDSVLGYSFEFFASLAIECWRLQQAGKHGEVYHLLITGLHLAEKLSQVPDSYVQGSVCVALTSYLYPAIAGLVSAGNYHTEAQLEELHQRCRRIQLLSLENQLELQRLQLLVPLNSTEDIYGEFILPYINDENLLTLIANLPYNPNIRNRVCNQFHDEMEAAIKTTPQSELSTRCDEIYEKYAAGYYDSGNSTYLRLLIAGQEARGKFWGAFFLDEYAWTGSYHEARTNRYQLQTSQLMLETILASKRYWIHQGRFPEKLDDLVPGYLAEIPLDSNRGQPFDYRNEGEKIRLKSWGWNGENDGEKVDDLVMGNWSLSLTPEDLQVPVPKRSATEQPAAPAEMP